MVKEFVVTPWEVKGRIDYEKLVKEFGLNLIDDRLIKRLERYLGRNKFITRKIFFAHRDLGFIL
ncbi:MAG: tryptophan--tRNA ligase, partial [Candidatus Nanoarchaeia archaeon]|nr:tryptophan--tRNA ligase [Candidatus Jingweiarchaeum tengchongense]